MFKINIPVHRDEPGRAALRKQTLIMKSCKNCMSGIYQKETFNISARAVLYRFILNTNLKLKKEQEQEQEHPNIEGLEDWTHRKQH